MLAHLHHIAWWYIIIINWTLNKCYLSSKENTSVLVSSLQYQYRIECMQSAVVWSGKVEGKKSKEKFCPCLWASRYPSSVATQIVFKQLGISYQVLQIKFEMHSQMWKDSTLWSQSPGWFLHKFLQKAIESWHQIIRQMKYIWFEISHTNIKMNYIFQEVEILLYATILTSLKVSEKSGLAFQQKCSVLILFLMAAKKSSCLYRKDSETRFPVLMIILNCGHS